MLPIIMAGIINCLNLFKINLPPPLAFDIFLILSTNPETKKKMGSCTSEVKLLHDVKV